MINSCMTKQCVTLISLITIEVILFVGVQDDTHAKLDNPYISGSRRLPHDNSLEMQYINT